jgi:hypothetical protein
MEPPYVGYYEVHRIRSFYRQKKKTRPEGLRDGFASDRVEKLKTTLHDSSAACRESLDRFS